jgi:hypothetical protein
MIPHLRVEKPRFLFLEGSKDAAGAAGVAAVAPPDASATRADTSVAGAESVVDRLAMGAPVPAPGACSLAASAASGGGRGLPPLGEGTPPVVFFLLQRRRRIF